MRLFRMMLALLLVTSGIVSANEKPPLTPSEAAKKVNEKVTMEMEVKSVGGRVNHYLNSEEDYTDDKNFTIFIAEGIVPKFKKEGIANPMKHFKGKVIQVTGTVVLEKTTVIKKDKPGVKVEKDRPWIKVQEPADIKIVTKDKEKK